MLAQTIALTTALYLMPAAGGGDSATKDSWITMKARLALMGAKDVKANKIHIDTDAGIVTLYGQVQSTTAKQEAESSVRKLDGVKRVDNMLQIIPAGEEKTVKASDESIKDQVEGRLSARPYLKGIKVLSVNDGVVVLGGDTDHLPAHVDAVTTAHGVAGVKRVESRVKLKDEGITPMYGEKVESGAGAGAGVLSDARATTEVKLRLLENENVMAKNIRVDTRDGRVALFGKVPSEEAKAQAQTIATNIGGVSGVDNYLTIDKKMRETKVSDKDLQKDVERILSREGLDDVDVAVQNGIINLTGKVDSKNEQAHAALLSGKAKGARAVKTDLEVGGQQRPSPTP